jgi:hypothetical protein
MTNDPKNSGGNVGYSEKGAVLPSNNFRVPMPNVQPPKPAPPPPSNKSDR